MDPDAVNLIKAALNLDIQTNSNQEEINMCQAVEEWKQELLDEGYANGEKSGFEKGEKLGIEKGEKLGIEKGEKLGIEKGEKLGIEKGENAILKAFIKNSGLSLNEIANMTCKPLSILESLADQTS